MLFALFFANETTVWIARVALATSAIHTVVEFAKNSAKSTRKVTKNSSKILLQFGNVTVSCVGYFLEFVCRLRIKTYTSITQIALFLILCHILKKKSAI